MLASARHYTIGIIPTVDVGKLVAWLRKVDPVFSFHSVLQGLLVPGLPFRTVRSMQDQELKARGTDISYMKQNGQR